MSAACCWSATALFCCSLMAFFLAASFITRLLAFSWYDFSMARRLFWCSILRADIYALYCSCVRRFCARASLSALRSSSYDRLASSKSCWRSCENLREATSSGLTVLPCFCFFVLPFFVFLPFPDGEEYSNAAFRCSSDAIWLSIFLRPFESPTFTSNRFALSFSIF